MLKPSFYGEKSNKMKRILTRRYCVYPAFMFNDDVNQFRWLALPKSLYQFQYFPLQRLAFRGYKTTVAAIIQSRLYIR